MMRRRPIWFFTMNVSFNQSPENIPTVSPYHEDIAQVGMLGLLGAIRRYDPEFGRSFEAFAVPTIIGEIKRFLRDKTWAIHVPRRIKELGPKIKAAVETLTIEMQRSPLVSEIAEYLDVEEELSLKRWKWGEVIKHSRWIIPLMLILKVVRLRFSILLVKLMMALRKQINVWLLQML